MLVHSISVSCILLKINLKKNFQCHWRFDKYPHRILIGCSYPKWPVLESKKGPRVSLRADRRVFPWRFWGTRAAWVWLCEIAEWIVDHILYFVLLFSHLLFSVQIWLSWSHSLRCRSSPSQADPVLLSILSNNSVYIFKSLLRILRISPI